MIAINTHEFEIQKFYGFMNKVYIILNLIYDSYMLRRHIQQKIKLM